MAGLHHLLLAATLCFAQEEEIPSLAPTVATAIPHGVGRGQTVEVELRGSNLIDTQRVEFFGRGVTAEVLSSTRTRVRLRVKAAADAEAGRRDFRLATPRGAVTGVFDVSPLEEIAEAEPNDDPRKAQRLRLPALVNGIVATEDWDHYIFHAEAGERLLFEVNATRCGSRLDADLALLDAKGVELAWNDDYTIFGDPRIEYTFATAGDYIVRVGSLAGGGNSDYRLIAGRLPSVTRSLPAGLQAGTATTITLDGYNLSGMQSAWLGDHLADAQVLSSTDRQARIRLTAPAGAKPGKYWLHVQTKDGETPIPVAVHVSDTPELTIARPPMSRATAQPVRGPLVINGAIEQENASHYFAFDAAAGESFVFRADGQRLDYHTDPVITILDAAGKTLAAVDDPGVDDRADEYQIDPTLSFTAEKAGRYLVAVRDGMYRGGPLLVYRLTMTPTPPDFILELYDPQKTIYTGQRNVVQLRVRRRAGWNTPVEVWAEGLPEGVKSGRQTAEPKDSVVTDTCGRPVTIDGTIVFLPIEAARSGAGQYTVRARGQMNGRTVEHAAVVRYQRYAAGYTYGPMQRQQAEITVLPAPIAYLSTPESVTVDAGGAADLKVNIARYGAAKNRAIIIKATSMSGIAVEQTTVPADAKTATLKVAARGEGRLVLSAALDDGTAAGESLPILIKAAK